MLTHDPYVTVDPELRPLDEVVAQAGPADHRGTACRATATSTVSTPVVDIWNLRDVGVRV